MTVWRIVFMGTPDFAVPALEALATGEDPLVGVFTQPDKPSGRGLRMMSTPVKVMARELGIPVLQPERLRRPEAVERLRLLQPDLVVVAAYGQILSPEVLALPTHGCINVHASLLPRWRGAAPIHRALLAGDAEGGVTIMGMDAGLDSGPILSQRAVTLPPGTTGGMLHDMLARMGGDLLMETIEKLKQGAITPRPQPETGMTYAAKLTRQDSWIDWQQPAAVIQRQLWALDPWPTAEALLADHPHKLFNAHLTRGRGAPGQIIALHADGPEVACGQGSLVITEIQPPGKRRMAAGDWLRGHAVAVGDTFTSPALDTAGA